MGHSPEENEVYIVPLGFTVLFSFQKYAEKPRFYETYNVPVTRSICVILPISPSTSVHSNLLSHLVPSSMDAIALHSTLLSAPLSPFSPWSGLFPWVGKPKGEQITSNDNWLATKLHQVSIVHEEIKDY